MIQKNEHRSDNRRERATRRALDRLNRDRFTAFIRHIRSDAGCLAVQLMNQHLDAGEPVDAVFFDGDEFGFHLELKRIGLLEFSINFGCTPGPLLGDGGQWRVRFDQNGAVIEAEAENAWIS